ncbi:hypothetical protein RRG08_035774 [Elysia crispata]|uniref:Uncharacterized protein n=1 Tax=Elysia crispata TaxID=231223 RepID=A0AAE1DI87_9GAST|nr:hypothetical protein RRG08_035774 [Elysia crispata]
MQRTSENTAVYLLNIVNRRKFFEGLRQVFSSRQEKRLALLLPSHILPRVQRLISRCKVTFAIVLAQANLDSMIDIPCMSNGDDWVMS